MFVYCIALNMLFFIQTNTPSRRQITLYLFMSFYYRTLIKFLEIRNLCYGELAMGSMGDGIEISVY